MRRVALLCELSENLRARALRLNESRSLRLLFTTEQSALLRQLHGLRCGFGVLAERVEQPAGTRGSTKGLPASHRSTTAHRCGIGRSQPAVTGRSGVAKQSDRACRCRRSARPCRTRSTRSTGRASSRRSQQTSGHADPSTKSRTPDRVFLVRQGSCSSHGKRDHPEHFIPLLGPTATTTAVTHAPTAIRPAVRSYPAWSTIAAGSTRNTVVAGLRNRLEK